MKTTVQIWVFILGTLIFSCNNDEPSNKEESVYKGNILNYFDRLKENATDEQDKKIDELSKAVNYNKTAFYDLKYAESLVIADIEEFKPLKGYSKIKVYFILNNSNIVRSGIVAFNDHIARDDRDKTIIRHLNAEPSKTNYSGKISFFSPFTQLLSFN